MLSNSKLCVLIEHLRVQLTTQGFPSENTHYISLFSASGSRLGKAVIKTGRKTRLGIQHIWVLSKRHISVFFPKHLGKFIHSDLHP